MKKIMTVLLCVTMIMSLNLTVFAETVGTDDFENNLYTTQKSVSVEYQESSEPETVYHIEIDWNDFVYTYSEAEKEWDSEELEYVETSEAGWSGEPTIKITNRSNKMIFFNMDYAPLDTLALNSSINMECSVAEKYAADFSEENGVYSSGLTYTDSENIESEYWFNETLQPGIAPYIIVKWTITGDLESAIKNYETTNGTIVDTTEQIPLGRVSIHLRHE